MRGGWSQVCVKVRCFLWAPDRLSRMHVFLMMALPILTSVAIVLAFQYFYWGDWLPNTYRLKVEGFTAHARLDKGLRVLAKTLPFMSLVALATFVTLLKFLISIQLYHNISNHEYAPILVESYGLNPLSRDDQPGVKKAAKSANNQAVEDECRLASAYNQRCLSL